MNYRTLRLAITNLCPDGEYSIDEADLDKLTWINGTKPPTKNQIIAEMAKVEAQETQDAANKQVARAALLDRLGITEDEAKLLLQ